MSRSSLDRDACGNELSEKNLNNLNLAMTMSMHNVHETNKSSNPLKPLLSTSSQTKTIATSQESSAETSSEPTPEKGREIRVRKSYAAFCEEFTLSGPQMPKRKFDISMCMEETEEEQTDDAQPRNVIGDSPSLMHEKMASKDQSTDNKSSEESDQDSAILYESKSLAQDNAPSINYLRPPPPQIMTPSVYQDEQRAMQEQKRARRQRILGPLWSLFSKRQPLQAHRLDIES